MGWLWFILYCVYAFLQAIFVARATDIGENDHPSIMVVLMTLFAPFVSFFVVLYYADVAIKKAVIKKK